MSSVNNALWNLFHSFSLGWSCLLTNEAYWMNICEKEVVHFVSYSDYLCFNNFQNDKDLSNTFGLSPKGIWGNTKVIQQEMRITHLLLKLERWCQEIVGKRMLSIRTTHIFCWKLFRSFPQLCFMGWKILSYYSVLEKYVPSCASYNNYLCFFVQDYERKYFIRKFQFNAMHSLF